MVPTDFVPTLEELKTSVAAQYRSRFPTKAHDRDSFFGKTTSAVAMSLLGFIKRLKNVAANQVPGWDNDQLGAASWGESIGIPSNNPNSRYGPNLARPASGGVGLAKGTPASVINDGTSLVNTLFVLDEPSIGLHQRDNQRLIETLVRLRDLGNTIIVVEHDEETMKLADWIVDVGQAPADTVVKSSPKEH